MTIEHVMYQVSDLIVDVMQPEDAGRIKAKRRLQRAARIMPKNYKWKPKRKSISKDDLTFINGVWQPINPSYHGAKYSHKTAKIIGLVAQRRQT